MELKRIGVLSLGKIAGLFSLISAILSVILLVVVKKLTVSVPAELISSIQVFQMASELTANQAMMMILWNAIWGFVIGLLIALIYNLLARYIGGVKLEIYEKKK